MGFPHLSPSTSKFSFVTPFAPFDMVWSHNRPSLVKRTPTHTHTRNSPSHSSDPRTGRLAVQWLLPFTTSLPQRVFSALFTCHFSGTSPPQQPEAASLGARSFCGTPPFFPLHPSPSPLAGHSVSLCLFCLTSPLPPPAAGNLIEDEAFLELAHCLRGQTSLERLTMSGAECSLLSLSLVLGWMPDAACAHCKCIFGG